MSIIFGVYCEKEEVVFLISVISPATIKLKQYVFIFKNLELKSVFG